jgi:hypothetical protein
VHRRREGEGPDRAEIQGTVCVPLASGDAFPVKVLFAFEGGKLDLQLEDAAERYVRRMAGVERDP